MAASCFGRSGRKEVYVQPFPNTEDDGFFWQVSANGGTEPVWAHSGTEVFYRNGAGEMVVAGVVTRPTFEVRSLQVLFDSSPYTFNPDNRLYAISPDDQRFLLFRVDVFGDDRPEPELIVVENFFEELKAKVGN